MAEKSIPIAAPLPRSVKFGWSCGAFLDVLMANSFSYLALPIYNIGLHLDPRFIGWGLGAPRIWEAISDIFIGNLSDNTRSKWGRRRPYMCVGAALCGGLFFLAWSPPIHASAGSLGAYFLLIALIYYTAYAIFSIPWGALGLELSSDSRERMRVQAYRNAMQAFGGIFLGSLWWLSFKFGKGNELSGVHDVAILFGILIVIAGLTAAFSAKEKVEVQSQAKIPLFPAIGATLRNREFLSVCGIVLLALIGITIVLPFSLYINIYYVFGGQKEPVSALNMVMNLIFQVLSIGFTPIVSGTAARIGKKKTLIFGLILGILGNLVSWWAFQPGWPYFQIVVSFLHAISMAAIWIIIPSMIADLCDLDEYRTGLRREGMYNATYAWITKAGVSAAFILSGYLMSWSGLDSALKAQPHEVIVRMRLLYMLVTPIFFGGALILAMRYSLTETESARLRGELDLRRRKSAKCAEEREPGGITV